MLVKDKIEIITGAARGIGKGIAEVFSENEAKVILCDINYKGVLKAAETKKYNVISCNSNYDIKSEERDIRTLMGRVVDGLLLTMVAFGQLAAFSLLYTLPIAGFYLISQKYMSNGFILGGSIK